MSWDTFRDAASALLAFQRALFESKHPFGDEWNWEWEVAPSSNPLHKVYPGYGFLISRNNIRQAAGALAHNGPCTVEDDYPDDAEAFVDLDSCAVDAPTLQSNSSDSMSIYEFHIVYSPTYKVPLLFLRGHLVDGTLLGTATVQAHMSAFIDGAKFISQDEHPVLGLPLYFLHPCETAACLSLLLNHQSATASSSPHRPAPCLERLLAWLTLVQPCTRIRVPVAFATSYLASLRP